MRNGTHDRGRLRPRSNRVGYRNGDTLVIPGVMGDNSSESGCENGIQAPRVCDEGCRMAVGECAKMGSNKASDS